MIKRIDSLRDFGIFRNFRWNGQVALPEFKRLNLIYGWNYSGKTTLSRVFQSLEQKSQGANHPTGTFKVVLEDGSEIESPNLQQSPPVRVFNRDFINNNFKQEHTAPAVFILGAENDALKNRRVQLEARKRKLTGIATKLETVRRENVQRLDELGTNRARDIANLLGDRNFRRPNLEQRINEVRRAFLTFILREEDAQAKLSTLRSGSEYSVLSSIPANLPDLSVVSEEVGDLLNQTASNNAIERLKGNPDLENWVRQGLILHKEQTICEFCRSPLNDTRLVELRAHFSTEYEILIGQLREKIAQIRALDLNPTIHDEMRLLSEFRPEFAGATAKFIEWLQWTTECRNQLIAALERKQKAIESREVWHDDISRAKEGLAIIHSLNDVIERHNRTISHLDDAKKDAKTALERHYAAQHFQDNGVEPKEDEIKGIGERINHCGRLNILIDDGIRVIELKIRQSSIAASKLNELLNYLLLGSNIEVANLGDVEFEFRRNGSVANNLSEGEKTAVCFAYFLTSLESNGASVNQTIIFVDDPISSLDSNHVYAVYALLAEKLETCRQLFVSTHNSEFFNLLKGRWLDRRSGRDKLCSFYYVSRILQPDRSIEGQLSELPKLLRKFKSEYEFVFSQLYAFKQAQNPTENDAYNAPNLLRKFLEAYLGFQKPDISAWYEKLDLLLDSPAERKEIHKFADDASHLQTLNRSLQFPSFVASSQRCVQIIIEALRIKDQRHYDSLVSVVT